MMDLRYFVIHTKEGSYLAKYDTPSCELDIEYLTVTNGDEVISKGMITDHAQVRGVALAAKEANASGVFDPARLEDLLNNPPPKEKTPVPGQLHARPDEPTQPFSTEQD